MKKKWLLVGMLLGALLIPTSLLAAEWTGSIQGFNCVTQGKVCPVGKEDPMAAVESVFVLYMDKDGSFYFLPNVDRAVLVRHLNTTIRIVGDMNDKYKAIHVKEIYARAGDKWRKTWSADLLDEIYEDIMGGHPLKRGK